MTFEVLIGNEVKKIEDLAKALGFDGVFFIDQKKIILIKTENKDELRKEISRASSKGQKMVVLGATDEINRIAVSDKRVSILLAPESTRTKDYMHYRSSGLNHVLCKLAIQNGVAIGIGFDAIKSAKGKDRADRIGRTMQNIDLCRKYKTPMILASFGKKPSDPYALRSFGLSLGMRTDQVKSALEQASKSLT